jgi:hypothetical protein
MRNPAKAMDSTRAYTDFVMSVRQFDHYLKLQQQLAQFRRARRVSTVDRAPRCASPGVVRAKDWLESAVRSR